MIALNEVSVEWFTAAHSTCSTLVWFASLNFLATTVVTGGDSGGEKFESSEPD